MSSGNETAEAIVASLVGVTVALLGIAVLDEHL